MSAYEVTGDWESPRKKKQDAIDAEKKVEHEIAIYKRSRFAFYMGLVDIGALDQDEAFKQLRDELEAAESVDLDATQPIDLNALKEMLGDEQS